MAHWSALLSAQALQSCTQSPLLLLLLLPYCNKLIHTVQIATAAAAAAVVVLVAASAAAHLSLQVVLNAKPKKCWAGIYTVHCLL
jgi:hypothetical protein